MAWKAQLTSISGPTVPTDEILVNITYRETVSGKTFTKQYAFNPDSLPNVQALRDFARNETAKLTRFDNVRDLLQGSIGQDL
jgi:hypothetical protein